MAIKHYLDDIPSSPERVYRIETNGDISTIADVTEYEQKGSTFGADDVNKACTLECDYYCDDENEDGRIHILTTPNEKSENIKFFATAPFRKWDRFMVNDVELDALTMDGRLLWDNFFVANTMVECLRRDDTLYFSCSSEQPLTDDETDVKYRFGIENGMMYMEEV